MSSRRPLAGRVALVTGASRGIGEAAALALAEAGADLVLTSTRDGGCEHTAREVVARGSRALALAHDAGSPADAERVARAALSELGRVDVLVNNAGMVVRARLEEMTDADFDRVLAVNLSGPFYLCRRLVPAMVERGFGRVVNVSSISATLGTPTLTAYCASKWGLDGLTRSLAAEVEGKGVLVASVLPGSVATDMLKGSPFPAKMQPSEVASVIRYLCAEAPLAMNGSRVEVFG